MRWKPGFMASGVRWLNESPAAKATQGYGITNYSSDMLDWFAGPDRNSYTGLWRTLVPEEGKPEAYRQSGSLRLSEWAQLSVAGEFRGRSPVWTRIWTELDHLVSILPGCQAGSFYSWKGWVNQSLHIANQVRHSQRWIDSCGTVAATVSVKIHYCRRVRGMTRAVGSIWIVWFTHGRPGCSGGGVVFRVAVAGLTKVRQ